MSFGRGQLAQEVAARIAQALAILSGVVAIPWHGAAGLVAAVAVAWIFQLARPAPPPPP